MSGRFGIMPLWDGDIVEPFIKCIGVAFMIFSFWRREVLLFA